MTTLFDQMAIFSPNRTKRIIEEIEYEVTTGFVKVNLTTSVNDSDYKDENYFIRLEDLHKWVSEQGYLDWTHDKSDTVTGQHVQESGILSFVDYLQNYMTEKDLHEYLISKGIIDLKYIPA